MSISNLKTSVSRMAVGSLTAFAVCLMLCASALQATAATGAFEPEKARTRAERALREGQYELAAKLFRELLDKDAHDKEARLGLSYTLLKLRNFTDAYDHAARVIAADPLSSHAHALLGTVILSLGDFRLSVEEFRTALSLKADEALAIAGLAMVDFYENRLAACINGLRRASLLSPNEPDFIFGLAQAAARAERYKEAADAYERFLVIAPLTDTDRRARIRGLIDFLRYLGNQSGLYNTAGENQVSVPFDIPNNRPIIKVRINGSKQPFRFVLDTGSGMSVISEETARLLGVRAVARGGMARAVGGKFEIVYGFLQSLEVGDVRVENVPVYIRRFYNDETPVDGYIGLAVISKYLTTVDYGANTFALTRQRPGNETASKPLAPLAPGVEFPIRTTQSGFLSSEVRIEGIEKHFNFIVDTGASISVVAEKMMELEAMSSYQRSANMRVYGAAGVAEGVRTLTLPRVLLGAHAREKLDVAVLDLEAVNETTGFIQDGIIGGNFLRHFRVTFDFKRGVVRLEPITSGAPKTDGDARGRANVDTPQL